VVAAESDDDEEEDDEEVIEVDSAVVVETRFEAVRARHATAIAAALTECAGESESSDDGDAAHETKERCMIWGCKRQLLRCFGVKSDVGVAVGCAESAHVLCAACLSRWWAAHNQLRAAKGLDALHRKVCPCCKAELRQTGEMRGDSNFHMGLLKVHGTWD